MRRQTTNQDAAPEPIDDQDAITGRMRRPSRGHLAEGSDVHDIDAILRDYLEADARAPRVAPVELVLYVVDGSAACAAARRQLDEILRWYMQGDVRLVVRSLSGITPACHIAVPTLVIRGRRVVTMSGDIDPAALLDVLATSGARPLSSGA